MPHLRDRNAISTALKFSKVRLSNLHSKLRSVNGYEH